MKGLYVRRRTDKLSDHIEHNTNPWYIASKRKLKSSVRHKMKRIFVGILDALDKEKENGQIDSEVYRRLRSRVLNAGNDQIRNMEIELDERYNIEALNYHIQMKVVRPEEKNNAG